MTREKKYFNVSQIVFWALIALLIILFIVKSDWGLFDEGRFARNYITNDSINKIAIEEETDKIDGPDTALIKRTWQWKSFDGKTYSFRFSIPKQEYESSKMTRLKSRPDHSCWNAMFEHDKKGLKIMVDAYKNIIKEYQLDYMQAMQMVVSSAQNFDYTYITINQQPCRDIEDNNGNKPSTDCKPKPYPHSCCDNVAPFAVYSPIEYAVNGAGDCDTKSLFAMTILKCLNMGFDAEMLFGEVEAGHHAMLGICVPNPPYRTLYANDLRTGKRYYAWECTQRSDNAELGAPVWRIFKNWRVHPIR